MVPSPLEEQLKLSPYVANAMVYGDNKPFNVAIVVANVDAVKEWAQANEIGTRDIDALLKDAKVVALFKQEIAKQAGQVLGVSRTSATSPSSRRTSRPKTGCSRRA